MIQDNTNYFNMNDFVGKNADVNTIDKFDFHSFYRAYVVDNQDNEKLGRVKIRIPALHENSTTYPWAYPATLTGFGFQTGMFILPPIGSLVWVTFEYSDEHRPIYFGGIPTTYADGKYQSYGPYINGNNPVKVTGNDIPFEYTGSQQIIYKSPKGSILYFDNGEINDLIVMKNVYGQGMEVGAIYDSDTGDYDRYTKMIYDDDNYVQINEGEFHLVLDGEDITLEPSTFNSYNELTNKPQINNVTLQGNKSWQDLGLPSIPTKVSDLENDTGFITKTVNNLTNYYLKTDTYTKTEVNNLIAQINSFNVAIVQVLPTTNIDTHTIYLVPKEGSTQDIYNEYLYVNNNWELLGTTEIDLTNYYTKTEVNTLLASKADISDIPPSMSILSYGHSTWNDFITAYNSKSIVYCRASSNSNPGTGSQTRLAFMAYVNNAETPTQVEFQYYRSVNAHSITQQGDQVYVYLLKNNNTWSVTVRESYTKIVAGTNMSSSYNNGTLTLNSSYTETDPIFSASPASGITSQDISNWNNKSDIIYLGTVSQYNSTQKAFNLDGLKKGVYFFYADSNNLYLKATNTTTSAVTVSEPAIIESNEYSYIINKMVYLYLESDIPETGIASNTTLGNLRYIRFGTYGETYAGNPSDDLIVVYGSTIRMETTYIGISLANKTTNAYLPSDSFKRVLASDYSANRTYSVGDYVKRNGYMYQCNTDITTPEAWTTAHWTSITITNLNLLNTINSKQDLLVSGTNIKTINNESILGSGNISISGGGDPVGIININDYTDNIVIATDLKKGTYVIMNSTNFGQTSMKIKYTSSNTSYLTFSDVDSGLIYVLEDIEEGMTDGTPIIYYDTLTTGGAASRHTIVLDSNNPHGLRGMSNAGSTRTIILSSGAQSINGVKTFSSLPESSVTPTSSNQLVNKQYVDDSILNSGFGLYLLDPSDYPNRTVELVGLKKGIYMWKDAWDTFNLKLDSSYNDTKTYRPIDRMIYVLQDITSSTTAADGEITLVPQYISSVTTLKWDAQMINTSQPAGIVNSGTYEISFVNTSSNQSINGVKTFNSLPLCSVVPTGSTQLVNKQYVDDCIANSITNVLGGSI